LVELGPRYARSCVIGQARQDPKVTVISSAFVGTEVERHPEVWGLFDVRSSWIEQLELRIEDTDDFERPLSEVYDFTNHRRVAAEPAHPEGVAEDDRPPAGTGAARGIYPAEINAKSRSDTQRPEQVGRS
jgi:hypothetical protein